MERRQKSRQRVIRGATGVAVTCFLAEFLSRSGLISQGHLPPLSDIFWAALQLLADPVFLEDLAATIVAALIGLALAIVTAVPAGILLGSYDIAYRATRAIVEFLRPIPTSAIIPVAILLFGQHLGMKVFLVTFSAVWPILFNTIYGVHDVEPIAKDTAKSFGYGQLRILAKVTLPSASPYIYGGIRIAGAVSLIVAVGAEVVTATGSGIGTFIMRISQSGAAQYEVIYAATIIAGVVGWLLNFGLVRGENRLFRWNPNMLRASDR